MHRSSKRTLFKRILTRFILTLAVVSLLVTAWLFYPHQLVKPQFSISNETTYFTEPLDDEGYVDYQKALNAHHAKDVTPENNVMALLMQALGPKPEGGKLPAEYYKRLGIAEPPEQGVYFVDFISLAKLREWPNTVELEFIDQWDERIKQRSWTREQFPKVVEWLEFNTQPMEIAKRASHRTKFYSPMVYSETVEPHRRFLMGVLLPTVQKYRELANPFVARAMLHMGEQKYEAAWNDISTVMRLGSQVMQGMTLIEYLTGLAQHNNAAEAIVPLLADYRTPVSLLKKIQKELNDQPPLPPLSTQLNVGERCMALDTFLLMHRFGPAAVESLGGGNYQKSLPSIINLYRKADWDPALIQINHWYDKMVESYNLVDRTEIEARGLEIHGALFEIREKFPQSSSIFETPQSRVDRMGQMIQLTLTPAVDKIRIARDKTLQRKQLLQLAVALAVFRQERGKYPATLNELAPQHIKAIPNDLFSDMPLIYKQRNDGYLLLSVGSNGVEDETSGENLMPGNDDIVIEIPLPALPKKGE